MATETKSYVIARMGARPVRHYLVLDPSGPMAVCFGKDRTHFGLDWRNYSWCDDALIAAQFSWDEALLVREKIGAPQCNICKITEPRVADDIAKWTEYHAAQKGIEHAPFGWRDAQASGRLQRASDAIWPGP